MTYENQLTHEKTTYNWTCIKLQFHSILSQSSTCFRWVEKWQKKIFTLKSNFKVEKNDFLVRNIFVCNLVLVEKMVQFNMWLFRKTRIKIQETKFGYHLVPPEENFSRFHQRPLQRLQNNKVSGKNFNQKYHNSSILSSINRIAGLFEFTRPYYFVTDPKLVKKLAVKDFDYFTDHRAIIEPNEDQLFTLSVFNMKGQQWRGERWCTSRKFYY